MYYVSTRSNNFRLNVSQAIVKGLAPDGGLITPSVIPCLPTNAFDTLKDMNYQQRALYIMGRFLDGFTMPELYRYTLAAYGKNKFSHPDIVPVRSLDDGISCLELWHGPTCAFKDMALQMLPHLMSASLDKTLEKRTACILTATSGDTGKAALEGFRDVPRIKIVVFYPNNGVSDIQELQMVTQEGGNVAVCAVEGNFDDAQTGVKKIFSDELLSDDLSQKGYLLSSANSINWGRVLPQVVYYISAYCDMLKSGSVMPNESINVCVPTGNFGNILAAFYAKSMGVPFNKLICASNQNNVLTDFIKTGVYDRNRPFFNTISPSMDILVSSNLERLLFELSLHDCDIVNECMDSLNKTGRYEIKPTLKGAIRKHFVSGFCDDDQTKVMIAQVWDKYHYLIDPHTAVAFHVLEEYRKESGDTAKCLVVSTASPFKFCDAVLDALGVSKHEPGTAVLEQLSALTGEAVPAPLAALKGKTRRFETVIEKSKMPEQVLELLK